MMRQTSIEGMSDEERLRTVDLADFAKMEEIRARVDSIVTDPATAEALKPWYGYFCKRPCFHDEYLQTFNRDNVTLVDTQGKGVERITADGVVVDGTEHSVDCLIFATGFEVGTEYSRRTGFEIVGRDGLTLTEQVARRDAHLARPHRQWLPELLHPVHRPVGFHRELPLSARCSGASHRRGDRVGSEARRNGDGGLCEAESAWVDTVVARTAASAQRAKSCTPGYYNREGQANAKTRQGSFFYGTPTEYADILEASRTPGVPEGFEIEAGSPPGRSAPMTRTRRYLAGRMLALGRRRSPRVVIIGAGFGGLAAAVALRRRGIDDLLIIERSDGVGGTWRQNIYPGAACDIQSHLYSFSFAPNRKWARTYAYQPEILAYLESVADDFDLRRHLMLDTSVRKAMWNEQAAHWEVELDDGRTTRRRHRRQRGRIVRRRAVPRHQGAHRLHRRPDAHLAMGRHRRPDRQAGGGHRHRRQRRAGRSRNRKDRSATDGIPAHAAVDGAQARPSVHRRRACALPSIPVGLAAGTVAAVEAAARQHCAHTRPSAAGRRRGPVEEFSAAPRR